MTMRRERRRRWSTEEKLQIVRETLRPGAVASVVAEQHGIGTGQLYTWRKQMLTAAMTGFAAVDVSAESPTSPLLAAPTTALGESGDPAASAMEVAVEVNLPDGTRVRVGKGAQLCCLMCWPAWIGADVAGRYTDLCGLQCHRHAEGLRWVGCPGADCFGS